MQIKTEVVVNAWIHDLYCKIPLCPNVLWPATIIAVTGNAVYTRVYPLGDPALSAARGSAPLSDLS